MKKKYSFYLLLFAFLIADFSTIAQEKKTVTELLGYPKNTKLLIIHADDMGVTHSENSATISAYEKGAISSGSIMVPCPWFPEIAAYARKHPEFDLGLHITLTSEWKYYQWDGVLPSDKIPSLINDSGYFYGDEEAVSAMVKHANLKEVEKEIRGQIDRAIAFGIKPTHLDSHMGGPTATSELFGIMLKLGKEYKIPVATFLSLFDDAMYAKQLPPDYISVDSVYTLYQNTKDADWNEAYNKMIKSMKPGLNELVIHLAFDNEEMHAVTVDRDHWWDAAWRQRDYNYITSEKFKNLLHENNIQLVTWRQIQKVMYPE
jgi:predicted glycoside hydrolase/deacetylase ChbG (UPF0249 family)